MTSKNYAVNLFRIVFLFYGFALCPIFLMDVNNVRLELLLYVIANLLVSVLFFTLIDKDRICVFSLSTYAIFFIVYVLKGALQYFIGLDTFWVSLSIGKTINNNAYIESLILVTFSHVIVATCLIFMKQFQVNESKFNNHRGLSPIVTKGILVFVAVLVLGTSIVMKSFGLAVMGKEAVELPFHLTGVVFYTRDILIPLILLFLIENSIRTRNKLEGKVVFIIYLLFVLVDIYLRASKSPLFIFILYLTSLYVLIKVNDSTLTVKLNKLTLFLFFLGAIALWPIIEFYRSSLSDNNTVDFTSIITSTSDFNIINVFLMFLDRLLGFLQFSGLVSDYNFEHDFYRIMEYENIGQYYTKYYLGFMQDGHLSSPSLLGTLYMLFGKAWWLVLTLYLIITRIIWSLTLHYKRMKNPVRVLLVFVFVNTIMAGTIDNALNKILIILFLSLILELAFRLKIRQSL